MPFVYRKPLNQNFELPDSFRLDDKPLDMHNLFRRTKLSDQLFYTDTRTELNLLLSALVSFGTIPQQVFDKESPDFEVVLPNGRHVFVEATFAIENAEARADMLVADLSFGLAKWAYEDNGIEEKTRGINLAFFMPFPPAKKEFSEALDEMKRFISTEDLPAISKREVQRVPDAYPILHQHDVKYYCSSSSVSSIQVTRGAMSVASPRDQLHVVTDAVARKRKIAASWKDSPLWLVVWMIGHYYNPDETLKYIDGSLELGPFERIYFGGGKNVVLVSDEPIDDAERS